MVLIKKSNCLILEDRAFTWFFNLISQVHERKKSANDHLSSNLSILTHCHKHYYKERQEATKRFGALHIFLNERDTLSFMFCPVVLGVIDIVFVIHFLENMVCQHIKRILNLFFRHFIVDEFKKIFIFRIFLLLKFVKVKVFG